MRVETIIGLALFCPLASGCSLAKITCRNLSYEVLLAKEECLEAVRFCKLAEEAWNGAQCGDPQAYSKDYADGFKKGFIDYLDAGDNPDPAWLLPKCYQKLRYETPQGHQAMKDWFAGFRHGEAVAKESGYRELLIMHLPVMGPPPPPPPPGPPVPMPPPVNGMTIPPPADSAPVLTPPRRLPPPAAGQPDEGGQRPEKGPATKTAAPRPALTEMSVRPVYSRVTYLTPAPEGDPPSGESPPRLRRPASVVGGPGASPTATVPAATAISTPPAATYSWPPLSSPPASRYGAPNYNGSGEK